MTSDNVILVATVASFLAGGATVIGAASVYLLRSVSEKFLDLAMGLAAGVMLSASFFGLIAPSIQIGGVWRCSVGILFGGAFLVVLEKALPHIHRVTGQKGPPVHLNKIALFILAITIHNFPEGLGVGMGFSGGDMNHGAVLAAGIGIQNIVEGLAVALACFRITNQFWKAFLVSSFTCVVEPVGGFLGISVVTLGKMLIPYGMAFAAGAMLFVTVEELIPETHSRGNVRESTIGIMLGFTLMMLMENLFT